MQKAPKKELSAADIKKKFDMHLIHLERSADAYDQGYEDEAYRLATTLRVLLKNGNNSVSLLNQLNLLHINFLDTAVPSDEKSLISYEGIVAIAIGAETKYIAPLDDFPFSQQRPFEDWLNGIAFKDRKENKFSRIKIILYMAEQDGGVHVDPSLDAEYYALTRENSLGWDVHDKDGLRPMPGPERAAIRQIAHEVLKTLKEGYPKKIPPKTGGVIMAGATLSMTSAEEKKLKLGRNEKCYCGNGLKFKHCHGK